MKNKANYNTYLCRWFKYMAKVMTLRREMTAVWEVLL